MRTFLEHALAFLGGFAATFVGGLLFGVTFAACLTVGLAFAVFASEGGDLHR